MEFTLFHIAAAAICLLFSSALQGTVGFGAGLSAIPLLVMAGFTLPDAVTVNLISAMALTYVGAYKLRRDIDLAHDLRPALIRVVALVPGAYVLTLAEGLSQAAVKQIVGGVLLVFLLTQAAFRPSPKQHLSLLWEPLAFGLSGFMAGFCGMGGPPMVLWVMAHDWSAVRLRAFLFFAFAAGMIPRVLLLWWFFREDFFPPAILGLCCLPLTIVGTSVGLFLGARLPRRGLRLLAYGLLVLIAINAILSPWYPGSS